MKIAVLSDSVFLPTGYSNQMKQLALYLTKQGHEVHWFCHAYTGADLDHVRFADGTEFKFNMYGHHMGDMYFANSISKRLKELQPDRLIVLLDTFMLFPWFLNVDTAPAKTFFWYPSDGGAGLPKGCEAILKKINVPVAMAQFGQKQVLDYHDIKAEHIPHGINIDRFRPLSEQERLKLKEKWGFKDKFVIGVVARNQPRKALDRTIKAMKKVAEQIPEAVLFLHLDPNDPASPWKINDLIQRYGIENRVVYSGMEAYKGFDWDKMNDVYNIMDVFLLTTTGEGFGIPIIEAMACGIPVVATDYTTTPELVLKNNAGLGIDLVGTEEIDMFSLNSKDYDWKAVNGTMTGSWEVERGLCSISDCANKIKSLYNSPATRKLMGANGRKAVLEKYDFEIVGKQWEDLLK